MNIQDKLHLTYNPINRHYRFQSKNDAEINRIGWAHWTCILISHECNIDQTTPPPLFKEKAYLKNSQFSCLWLQRSHVKSKVIAFVS